MAKAKPEIPLHCRVCGNDAPERFTVERGGNSRLVGGKRRPAVNVVCRGVSDARPCGHEWVSVARAAVRRMRELDAAARQRSAVLNPPAEWTEGNSRARA